MSVVHEVKTDKLHMISTAVVELLKAMESNQFTLDEMGRLCETHGLCCPDTAADSNELVELLVNQGMLKHA